MGLVALCCCERGCEARWCAPSPQQSEVLTRRSGRSLPAQAGATASASSGCERGVTGRPLRLEGLSPSPSVGKGSLQSFSGSGLKQWQQCLCTSPRGKGSFPDLRGGYDSCSPPMPKETAAIKRVQAVACLQAEALPLEGLESLAPAGGKAGATAPSDAREVFACCRGGSGSRPRSTALRCPSLGRR
jgi:hypothetical protein